MPCYIIRQNSIDASAPTSLTLFKYDMTSAEEAGAWTRESYVSTGLMDESVNTAHTATVSDGNVVK